MPDEPPDIETIDEAFVSLSKSTKPPRGMEAHGKPTAPPRDTPHQGRLTPFAGVAIDPSVLRAMQATTPPAKMPSSSALRGRPGVLGFSHKARDGEVIGSENAPEHFEQCMPFLKPLAVAIGECLGLEGLREIHVVGKEQRYVSAELEDGSLVDVRVATTMSTREVVRLLRGAA
jgi:hypothetical protein